MVGVAKNRLKLVNHIPSFKVKVLQNLDLNLTETRSFKFIPQKLYNQIFFHEILNQKEKFNQNLWVVKEE